MPTNYLIKRISSFNCGTHLQKDPLDRPKLDSLWKYLKSLDICRKIHYNQLVTKNLTQLE